MKHIGYNYYATKDGEIYSSKNKKFISKRIGPNGYYLVNLSIDGKCKTFSLHRLIANAFIDNRDGLPVVNHLDGNKLNNKASNLEWTTYGGNLKHAREMGLLKPARGIKTKHGRFLPEDIRDIRMLLETKKYSWRDIAKMYNVTKSAIQYIANKKSYYYVQ